MNPIRVKVDTSLKSTLDFKVHVSNWVIINSNYHKGPRPYLVQSISGSFYVNNEQNAREGKELLHEPAIQIVGKFANAAGTKWNTRWYYWNWGPSSNNITFAELPVVIKEAIYLNVVNHLKDHVIKLTALYKSLDAQAGFASKQPEVLQAGEDEANDVFMTSVHLPKGTDATSRWENHDVSRWSVARKELNLPKPKRTRKKKVTV